MAPLGHKKHLGTKSELQGCAWLLEREYEVFRNVSSHGIVDIVALKDGKVLLLDAKTRVRNAKGPETITKEQAALGVLPLVITRDGKCYVEEKPFIEGTKTQQTCVWCKTVFLTVNRRKQFYCSDRCRGMKHSAGGDKRLI